eukprot:3936162-Pyramimonas_sp.AAC.1
MGTLVRALLTTLGYCRTIFHLSYEVRLWVDMPELRIAHKSILQVQTWEPNQATPRLTAAWVRSVISGSPGNTHKYISVRGPSPEA